MTSERVIAFAEQLLDKAEKRKAYLEDQYEHSIIPLEEHLRLEIWIHHAIGIFTGLQAAMFDREKILGPLI